MEDKGMYYTQDIEAVFDHVIGKEGLATSTYQSYHKHADSARDFIAKQKQENALPLLNLPDRTDDLKEILELASHIRSRFKHLVVLGTGGSSLGAQTLVALKLNTFDRSRSTQLHFVENVDPHTLSTLVESVNWQETAVLAVSKSGSTVETVAQTLVLLEQAKKYLSESELRDRFFIVTEPTDNPMRKLATSFSLKTQEHDPLVGGRFSVLSNVGLVPAAVAGVDVAAIRKGAKQVLDASLAMTAAAPSEPFKGAAINVGLMARNKNMAVVMPYIDRLATLGRWYRQLWAESIGKDGTGTTPIDALGTVDQHSQLQLYIGGPRDKMFTIIKTPAAGKGPVLHNLVPGYATLDYLEGKTMGDVLASHQRATPETLARNGCPVRSLILPEVTEASVGALLMHFMLETIFAAHLMQVNAFDQPGVEESKVLARKYLTESNGALV
jgi:glucose-6-phosphate isomerase